MSKILTDYEPKSNHRLRIDEKKREIEDAHTKIAKVESEIKQKDNLLELFKSKN